MKLIYRLYSPNEGKISIDGFDISKVELTSLRSQIGIVPQDPLLFSGTIRDNIALRDEASGNEIIRASKLACAHDFIMELPDGYSTLISEKGSIKWWSKTKNYNCKNIIKLSKNSYFR